MTIIVFNLLLLLIPIVYSIQVHVHILCISDILLIL